MSRSVSPSSDGRGQQNGEQSEQRARSPVIITGVDHQAMTGKDTVWREKRVDDFNEQYARRQRKSKQVKETMRMNNPSNEAYPPVMKLMRRSIKPQVSGYIGALNSMEKFNNDYSEYYPRSKSCGRSRSFK